MRTTVPAEELTNIGIVPMHGTVIIKAVIPEGSALVTPETADKNADMYNELSIAALGERAYQEGLRLGDKVAMQPLHSDVYVVYLAPGMEQPVERQPGDFDYLIFDKSAILGVLV